MPQPDLAKSPAGGNNSGRSPAAVSTHPVRSDDVDQVAVDRMIGGNTPVWWTYGERAAAVALLDGLGLSATQIAARLRISQRTVQRYRTAGRSPASAPAGTRYGHWGRTQRDTACAQCGAPIPTGARVRTYTVSHTPTPNRLVCEACGSGRSNA